MEKTKKDTGMKNTKHGIFGALTALHAAYLLPNMSSTRITKLFARLGMGRAGMVGNSILPTLTSKRI
jgi:hypothetical protein